MQVLLSWCSLLLACKKASYQRKSVRRRLYPLLVTVLVFAFTGTGLNFGERSQVRESRRLASEGNLWRSSGIWRRFFGKTTEFDARSDATIALYGGSQCVFNFEEDFPFVKFDSRTMESWSSISAAVSCVRKVGGPQHTKIELRWPFVRMKFSYSRWS